MEEKKKTYGHEIFATESIWKLMAKMCIPAVITILIMVIYNMADIYFIGQTGDKFKVTALSLCMPITTILSALGSMIGTGASSCISIAMGRKDTSKVRKFSSFSFYFSIITGIAYAAIIYLFMNPILDLIGTSANTRSFAQSYLIFMMLGAPLMMVNTTMGQVIRSEGAATQAMFGNMLGTVVNIILDPIFILIFQLGVPGAAIATVIGNTCSTVFYIAFMLKKAKILSISPKEFAMGSGIAVGVLSIGLPSGVSTLLNSLANIFENNLLAAHGDQYVAALSVAGRATMIIGMLQMGIAMGVQPIIAYSYGARNWNRMNETIKKTAAFTIGLGLVLTVLCRIFSGQLVAAFINDSEIIPLGIYVIGITTLVGPLTGVYQLCITFLQSSEKASYAVFVSVLRQGLVFIPALYLLDKFFAFDGIVWAQPAAMIFSLALAFALAMRHYRNIRKKDSQQVTQEAAGTSDISENGQTDTDFIQETHTV